MVTGNRSAKLASTISVRQHKVVSGLSAANGGQDEGPNPHELIEAALAACTILTVELYAQRKQMKLDNVEAKVQITSETKEGTVIARELKFIGDLTPEEKTRLHEIADKCPIHKLLEGKVTIETTVVS
jgi:putative redox protein